MEVLSRKRVLGGTKVGNGAWGLAWVDTVMDPQLRHKEDQEAVDAKRVEVGIAEAHRAEQEPESIIIDA